MSDINVTVNDEIVNIDIVDEPVLVNVVNSPGVPGAPGQGVPVGGTTGQVLAKNSNTNYDTEWVDVSGGVWGTITGTLSNQTDLQNALNAKVPYTGATANVNLGEYEIKAGQVTLDTSPTGTAAVGTTRWNDATGLSETTLKGGTVVLKNGVDLVARVVNKVTPNTTLTKAAYQAVRVSGAQGQRLAVAFAQANNDNNSADTIGLVTETIATNQEGFIITVGQLENINTTGSLQGETWADGDVLYLSPTTAGALTNVKPNATIGHIVVIGYVEYAHAVNGKIYVKVMNGWELGELHDVYVPTPSNNDVLTYETSSGLWKNKSVGTALGYTPANSATTLTINGVTYDLSANRSWTISTGISGSGASGQVAYWDGTTSQAGSADLTWNGTNVILGNDKGLVLQTAGTNRNILIKAAVVLDNFSGVNLYPQGGTNVGTALVISPKGTGFSAQLKSQVSLFNTDFFADSVNYEFAVLRAAGDRFSFSTGKQGTGTNRPFLLSSGYADGVTNANHLWLYTTGNVGINTSSDGGQRLQVQGTTLLNGNVTFSSATGMFWDASNSRLGIGTNAPVGALNIVQSDATIFLRNTGNNGYAGVNINDDTNTLTGSFQIGGTGVGALAGHFFFGARKSTGRTIIVGGASATQFATMFSTGNFLIQNGGTHSDSGERLQVTGTMKVTGNTKIGNTVFADTSSNLIIGIEGSAARGAIANANQYQDFMFVNTSISSGNINSWSFGQRRDTFFGNTIGSFQLLGAYTSNAGAVNTVGGGYLVPLICNPNGDVLINGGNANVVNRYIGLGVNAPTALTDIGASTTTRASLRIRSGTAPTSPNDGDIWYDGTNLYMRVGATTKTFTLI